MKRKIIVASSADAERIIQPYLDKHWEVKLCVAEHISATDSSKSGTWESKGHQVEAGSFVFILENNTIDVGL